MLSSYINYVPALLYNDALKLRYFTPMEAVTIARTWMHGPWNFIGWFLISNFVSRLLLRNLLSEAGINEAVNGISIIDMTHKGRWDIKAFG